MTLDPATLVVVACIMSSVVGGLLSFSWWQDRRNDALAWWSATCLIAAGASLLFLLGGAEMRSPAREVGNGLFAIAYGLSYAAARRFNDRPIIRSAVVGGALIWLIAVWGFDISFVGRVVTMSLVTTTYSFCTAYELWNGPNRLTSQRAAAVVTLLHGIYFASRAVMGPSLIPSLGWMSEFARGFDQTWVSMVGLVILLYVMIFGFLIMSMAKEKTDLEHRRAALVDPLTGVANRRGFMTVAHRRLEASARVGDPVAVLLFDLDHFKSINDRFGHQVGDEVLVDFCAAAVAALPAGSLFGRMGGEEFAAIVTGAPAMAIIDYADRVRKGFTHATRLEAEGASPTVSIGVATGGPRSLIEGLLADADRALYRAKAAGRDRVVVAESSGDRNTPSGREPASLKPALA